MSVNFLSWSRVVHTKPAACQFLRAKAATAFSVS